MKTPLVRLLLLAALAPLAGLQAQNNYATPYTFMTLAGSAQNAGSADGSGSSARFHSPTSVAVDADGYVYVADADNHTIRKVSPYPGGTTTTLAGLAGVSGSTDGTGSDARFFLPQGLAVDKTGTVYIADDNHVIRKITPDGVVTTIAGLAGVTGSADGAGSAARFNFPFGLAVDSAGNIFVADTGNRTIRKVTPDGIVTTIAGTAGMAGSVDGQGSAARFYDPQGVAVDQFGTLYIADTLNSTVRKITPTGNVTTFAGSALNNGAIDGVGSVARFYYTLRVAVGSEGNVFVTSGDYTVRMISPDGNVSTIAGAPGAGGSTDGVGNAARFLGPYGVAVDGAGNVVVAEILNHTIRYGTPPQVVDRVILSKTTRLVQASAADPVVDPRTPGPGYGGPYGFNAVIHGTSLDKITTPVLTLPAGSQYPTEKPFVHNGGVLTYDTSANQWRYGNNGGYHGTTTEGGRDTSFAAGTYGLTVLGAAFNLNLAAPSFPANAPVVTLGGGNWVAGKYVIDANQALTITSNAFANFNQNYDGAIELQVEGVVDQQVSFSDNPAADNFVTCTIPAGALVPGRDYQGTVSFFAVMDQATVPALGASINTARYEMKTQFTVSTSATTQPGARATFYALGDLDGGISFSDVRDVTKVGGVLYAVGGATVYDGSSGPDTPYLWTSTNGMVPLPRLAPDLTVSGSLAPAFASAITPDAAYIGGRSVFDIAQHIRHGVRVTTSGLVNLDLGTLPTTSHLGACGVTSISNDGSVMYGFSTNASGAPQAVRFTASGPTITAIPFLNVGDNTSSAAAHGASADGSIVIGTSSNTSISGGGSEVPGNVAFRYVEGSGSSAIPFLPGGTWNGALMLAPDGNVALLYGDAPGSSSDQPYTYNALTASTTALGVPAGYSSVTGGGINADGSLVASSFSNSTAESFVHNAAGWHSMKDLLARAGVTLADWTLEDVFGMSADGTLIWGRGTHHGNYEGWIVEFASGYLTSYGLNADFNSDGHADIVWQNTTNGDRGFWLMSGPVFSSWVDLGYVSADWRIAATADFNGDGKPDFLWENTSTGDRGFWLMNGTAYSSWIDMGIVSTDWRFVAAADFNGDGHADILMENTVTGTRGLWLMNGTAYAGWVDLGVVSTDWRFVAAADFNGDGKADILMENTVTGDRGFWLMDGTAYSSWHDMGYVSTDWHIAAVADFNADGQPDILWENTSTGDRGFWLMNGTAYSSWVDLGYITTDWRIAN